MGLVLLLYALFASVFTIAKTGLEYTSPLFLVGSRMLFAGALMLGYLYLFQKGSFRIRKQHLVQLVLLGVVNIYLTNAFEFWGLQSLTSSKTCFIYSLSPFVSALFSYFILSEKLNKKKWIGLFIGFLGFIPILLTTTPSEELTGGFFFLSWGEIYVMAAAVSSVYGWILLKQLVDEYQHSPMMANGLSMCIGGALALGHSYISEGWNPIPVSSYIPFLECAFLLVVISNFICYNLYGYLLKRYSATFISFAGFSTPLFTAIFGRIWLGEIPTTSFYLSAAVVLLGLFTFYQEELKRDYHMKSFTIEAS